MTRLRSYWTNFLAGEVTPLMRGRVDLNAYTNGAAKIRNFRQRVQGGLSRRPGLRHVQEITGITSATRLDDFTFSDDQSYIFLFSSNRLDIWDKDGNFIETITNVDPTGTGIAWVTDDQIVQANTTQLGNIMVVVHNTFPITEIRRIDATSFDVIPYTFEYDFDSGAVFQPYYPFHSPGWYFNPLGAGFPIAPGDTFQADCERADESNSNQVFFTADMIGDRVRWYVSGATPEWMEATIDSMDPATGDGGTPERFYRINCTAITDVSTGSRTNVWQQQAWGNYGGYPRAVALHEQRLCFGGSTQLPNHFWGSKTGAFRNFDVGDALDSDAIDYEIADNQVVEIRNMRSFRHLHIYTSEQEMYFPTSENLPMTPSNIVFRTQTRYGISNVRPKIFEGGVLFVPKTLATVREFKWDDIAQAYTAEALSLMSSQLIRSPVDLATQLEDENIPEQYAYIVNEDGTVAVLCMLQAEGINGWTLWDSPGAIIINVQTAGHARCFFLIKRTVNAVERLTLEFVDFDLTTDAAVRQTIAGGSGVITGLDHLEGGLVDARWDKLHLGQYTVSGGQIDLAGMTPADGSVVEVGLTFTPALTTLPPETQSNSGMTIGVPRRPVRATLDLDSTITVTVDGQRLMQQSSDPPNAQPEYYNERKDFWLRGWDYFANVEIIQEFPVPLTINSVSIEFEVNDDG